MPRLNWTEEHVRFLDPIKAGTLVLAVPRLSRFRCDSLLQAARNILGDIVVDAYIPVTHIDNTASIVRELTNTVIQPHQINVHDPYIITFVLANGKVFTVQASEWGGIQGEGS